MERYMRIRISGGEGEGEVQEYRKSEWDMRWWREWMWMGGGGGAEGRGVIVRVSARRRDNG